MRTEHLSKGMLFAGILGFAIGGCNGSGNGADGISQANDGDRASGGASASATKTSATTGGRGLSDTSDTAAGGEESTEQPARGGSTASGGTTASGGSKGTGGPKATGGTRQGRGGSSTGDPSSATPSGGAVRSSSTGTGGRSGGSGVDGTTPIGGGAVGGASIGNSNTGGTTGKGGATTGNGTNSSTSTNNGTCTASKAASKNASGSGPHKVTVETNSDPGINEGTIYRPTDLGGDEKYPIFVWGEGGCSKDGSSNATAMGEIASHGYFVIADGTPGGSGSRSMDSSNATAMGKPMIVYIDWAIAENEKPCSAYYHSLDTTKIATNGFSCGGLMAEGTAGDSRLTTWGITSSGMFSANQALYKTIHTPVLIVLGGPSDMAYENGERDYDNISALDVPIMLFSKDIGHGGDLFKAGGGDFNKINLAWLNWWLKGDETEKGKGLLVGSACTYCKDSAWEVKSKNTP